MDAVVMAASTAESVAVTATSDAVACAAPGPLQCVLHLPLPDAAAAQTLVSVLSVDEAVTDTQKTVQLRSDDAAERIVVVVLTAPTARALRVAVGAVLEQSKLVVRTLRAFPAL